MINLELYRIFFVVATEQNITKASEKLNISQPAVTKHIKNLESQLKTPLFVRTKKGVVLNEYGKLMFLKIKQALALIDDAEKLVSTYNNIYKGTIKIGISTSLTRKYLLKHIENFHKKYPNIIININTDPSKDLITQLKDGSIDMIICKFGKRKDFDLKYIKLGSTKYIFVANKKYDYLCKRKITLDELVKCPILLQKLPANTRVSVDEYFKNNNINIEPTMNIASSNLLVDFIKLGYGIGYVTKLYIDDELKNKDLYEIKVTPDTENIDYGIILLNNNIMPSYFNKFIEYLKKSK